MPAALNSEKMMNDLPLLVLGAAAVKIAGAFVAPLEAGLGTVPNPLGEREKSADGPFQLGRWQARCPRVDGRLRST